MRTRRLAPGSPIRSGFRSPRTSRPIKSANIELTGIEYSVSRPELMAVQPAQTHALIMQSPPSASRHVSESAVTNTSVPATSYPRAPGLTERFSHESNSDGHDQMLFRASSAEDANAAPGRRGLDQHGRHRMTSPQIRRPSVIPAASLSLGSGPRQRCRGPFPLHAPDDLSYLG
jgi:hypothetical protein